MDTSLCANYVSIETHEYVKKERDKLRRRNAELDAEVSELEGECENWKNSFERLSKNYAEKETLLKGADANFEEIEMLYPNWHRFRSLAEAIEVHTKNQDRRITNLDSANIFLVEERDELRRRNAELEAEVKRLNDHALEVYKEQRKAYLILQAENERLRKIIDEIMNMFTV